MFLTVGAGSDLVLFEQAREGFFAPNHLERDGGNLVPDKQVL
jgi:hypothetical protein